MTEWPTFTLETVSGEASAFTTSFRFLFSSRILPRNASRAYFRAGRAWWSTKRQRTLCKRGGHPKSALSTLRDWNAEPVTKCLRCREVV